MPLFMCKRNKRETSKSYTQQQSQKTMLTISGGHAQFDKSKSKEPKETGLATENRKKRSRE